MKKFLFAAFAALVAIGCTDEKKGPETTDPNQWVTNVKVPAQAVIGEELTIEGSGFKADCALAFRLNGETATTNAEVVAVDAQSLRVKVPSTLAAGFYALLLTQSDQTKTIGSTTVKKGEIGEGAAKLYAVAGENQEIFQVSVADQIVSETPLPNSSTAIYGYPGYAVVDAAGKVYYAAFDLSEDKTGPNKGKIVYSIGCYDTATATSITPVENIRLIAMGIIDGKFHILRSLDDTTYTLIAWDNGTETEVRTFDFTPLGSQRFLSANSQFVYHAPTKTIVLYGSMGSGADVGRVALSLDVTTGAVASNGGNPGVSYRFASVDETLFCFTIKSDEESVIETKAYRIDSPQTWTLDGTGSTLLATLSKVGFDYPVYSPGDGKIYGMNSLEDADRISAFDPKTGTFDKGSWVNPPLAYLISIPDPEAE